MSQKQDKKNYQNTHFFMFLHCNVCIVSVASFPAFRKFIGYFATKLFVYKRTLRVTTKLSFCSNEPQQGRETGCYLEQVDTSSGWIVSLVVLIFVEVDVARCPRVSEFTAVTVKRLVTVHVMLCVRSNAHTHTHTHTHRLASAL